MRVIVEVAAKRAFASAVDWPGWSRGAKTAEGAVETLVAYAPRYETVARRAGILFEPGPPDLVEQATGNASTEFGIPAAIATLDAEPLTEADLQRWTALLEAAWATVDDVAAAAVGVSLAKGPRGGGRDLDKIIGHVTEAEVAYLGQLGSRPPSPHSSWTALRAAFIDSLEAISAGRPLPNPRNTQKPWPPRYAIRRSAWHALDHAWEIEDRSAG